MQITLNLTYTRGGRYKVMKATNTTEFCPGLCLTKAEVEALISRKIKIVITR